MEFSKFKYKSIKQWQDSVLKLCWIISIGTLAIEISLIPLFLRKERTSEEFFWYLIIRILTPTIINFSTVIFTSIFCKSSKADFQRKSFMLALCLLIKLSVLSVFHSYYQIFLLAPSITIFPTVFFYNKNILRRIFIISLVIIFISLIIWIYDYAYGKIATIYGTTAFIILTHTLSYYFTKQLIRFVNLQDKILIKNYNRQKELIEELHVDPLTRVYNRVAFSNMLQACIKTHNPQEGSLILGVVDVDNFHDFNSVYGHAKGDEVLSIIANELKNVIGGARNIFRYGGDEFCILFNKQDLNTIEQIAQKICTSVSNLKLDFIKDELELSISVGVASYKKNMSEEEFFSQADLAMYEAKKSGKNKFVIFP